MEEYFIPISRLTLLLSRYLILTITTSITCLVIAGNLVRIPKRATNFTEIGHVYSWFGSESLSIYHSLSKLEGE